MLLFLSAEFYVRWLCRVVHCCVPVLVCMFWGGGVIGMIKHTTFHRLCLTSCVLVPPQCLGSNVLIFALYARVCLLRAKESLKQTSAIVVVGFHLVPVYSCRPVQRFPIVKKTVTNLLMVSFLVKGIQFVCLGVFA